MIYNLEPKFNSRANRARARATASYANCHHSGSFPGDPVYPGPASCLPQTFSSETHVQNPFWPYP